MTLTLDEGARILAFAREVIELDLKGLRADDPEGLDDLLLENRGVFVTLDSYPSGSLRGCIGYPEPVMALGKAVRDSALSAALKDPRFPSVKADEMESITVEVSVLTEPQKVRVEKPLEYPSKIKVGRDGLIIRKGWQSGLLLPQVPVEHGWDEKEFLSHTCGKAGLPPDEWLAEGVQIFSFQAQVFSEKEPHGEVEEKKLS
ncbi:MAG: TIGR00296 family protein [Methanobacteriota archaeon]